jgi:hypothetical protein
LTKERGIIIKPLRQEVSKGKKPKRPKRKY